MSQVLSTLQPNPVARGSLATLHVSDEGLPPDTLVGVSVRWECWDGDEWVETHLLWRGVEPFDADATALAPGTTIYVPLLGLGLPSTETVRIPDVPPGTYRLTETATQPGGGRFVSYLIVEVTSE